jgi:urease accessory protein
MTIDAFLSLVQFADGLFPAGAYAHSFGLESCVQAGSVRDAAGVEYFLRTYLEGVCAPTDAVALVCAWRAARSDDLESCFALDAALDAMKTASEPRDASRQMGRQTLRIATNLTSHVLLGGFFEASESGATPGHHPVAFGLVGSAMGWPSAEAVCAYLHSSCASLGGAALRLLPLGQLAGQRILWNLRPLIADLAHDVQSKDRADLWSFAPALEIAAMQHTTLSARLFRS